MKNETKEYINKLDFNDLFELQHLLPELIKQKGTPNLEQIKQIILNFISATYNVTENQLRQKTRKRNIAEPRHAAMYFLHKAGCGNPEMIGRMFNRDRCTALHAINKMEFLIEHDASIRQRLKSFKIALS